MFGILHAEQHVVRVAEINDDDAAAGDFWRGFAVDARVKIDVAIAVKFAHRPGGGETIGAAVVVDAEGVCGHDWLSGRGFVCLIGFFIGRYTAL